MGELPSRKQHIPVSKQVNSMVGVAILPLHDGVQAKSSCSASNTSRAMFFLFLALESECMRGRNSVSDRER